MFVINDELKEFFESGVAVLIGTVAADGTPRLAYAWGPRVHPDATSLSVYVDRERADGVLGARIQNPQIAVTFTDPVSVRSLQVKGQILDVGEPTDAERAWVTRHRDAFTASTSLIGDPPTTIRNLWMDETVRVDLSTERAFDQTPGPQAGAAL
jgi:hypothetical protein